MIYITYAMATWDLPNIYVCMYAHALGRAAIGLGHIYQVYPSWRWYNYYICTAKNLSTCVYTHYNSITLQFHFGRVQLLRKLLLLQRITRLYRTLRGRDQREKCALNVIKHTFQANSTLLTTKSALTVQ